MSDVNHYHLMKDESNENVPIIHTDGDGNGNGNSGDSPTTETPISEQQNIIHRNLYNKIQWFVWNTLEQKERTYFGLFVNVIILGLILITVIGFVLSTDAELLARNVWLDWTLIVIEFVATFLFLFEYMCRFFACTAQGSIYCRYGPFMGRLYYTLSIWSLIDLLSFLPSIIIFIASLILNGRDHRGIRDFRSLVWIKELTAFRILRLFRLLKAEKYFHGWKLISRVIFKKRAELMTTIFINSVILLLLSSLLYFIENSMYRDPKTGAKGNPNFQSLLKCIYYCVITLTTVGQGDVFPVTPGGKFITLLCALSAISAFSIPASIISSGFVEELQAFNKKKEKKKEKTLDYIHSELMKLKDKIFRRGGHESKTNSELSIELMEENMDNESKQASVSQQEESNNSPSNYTMIPHGKTTVVGDLYIHTCPHCNRNSLIA
jgi:voltage-gated potassium channel